MEPRPDGQIPPLNPTEPPADQQQGQEEHPATQFALDAIFGPQQTVPANDADTLPPLNLPLLDQAQGLQQPTIMPATPTPTTDEDF